MILLNPQWKVPGLPWPFYAQACLNVRHHNVDDAAWFNVHLAHHTRGITIKDPLIDKLNLPKTYHPMVIQ